LIAEPTVLAYPDCSKPFVLYTDASDVGKKQEHKFRIIRYLSRTLAPAERNYSSPERECLAIMTDCKALLTLKENANFVSRLMRWHLALQQFTFGIKHVKGEENLGDILSRIDLSDLESKSLGYSLESDFDSYGLGFVRFCVLSRLSMDIFRETTLLINLLHKFLNF
jgi:hypothetical protein